MRTIRLEEPGRFVLADTADPGRPGPDEALVRVRRIGVCGTDLHAFRGRQPFFAYPRILGHELGVTIEQVGPNDQGLSVGDRCAVEPYLSCGQCVACRRGKPNCCTSLEVLGVHVDGGMRERLIVPIAKLHRSDQLTLEQLALVETLGIGAHAVDRAQVQAGENVLVIGAGPIGLSVVQFAKIAGARIIIVDVNDARLEFCRRELGVEHVVQGKGDVQPTVERLTSGELPTVVFDATGNPDSMMASFELVASGGKLVFVGLFPGDVTFHDPHFHRRELTLLASRNSTRSDFTRIIRLIEEGALDTTPWITHRSPFEAMIAHFPAWLDPSNQVVKAMVDLDA